MLPVRGATMVLNSVVRTGVFQSMLPVRGATSDMIVMSPFHIISIHAPRAGSDCWASEVWARMELFQSMLPVRGATVETAASLNTVLFQSMLPVRGATPRR